MEPATARLKQVNSILLAVLGHSPGDRPAFLEQACDGDEALRREVESLLLEGESQVDSGGGFEPPAFALGLDPPGPSGGDSVGPYRIVRKLGQGGMGAVFLAERADGEFDRQVAIKILKPGMATAELARRFRVERQILANLDHPGIAKLHEGGTSADGLPYLVMEYVEGEPIDRYCQTHRLGIRERLELFRGVCSAVAFAHRNLVVHRDLKPSNILVTPEGVPKLLDFGIAKLLDADTLRPITLTEGGALPMTPDYASPEQVRRGPITTASDVYSLGFLLYELLAGQRPYRLREYRLEEVHRVVCEHEPPRPSAVAGASGEDPRPLRGDLDNIVLMALRKEPQDRYGSVELLSDDLGRYLEGLPVRASRGTFAYRWRKLLHRRRREVAALLVALLGLTAFAVDRDLQSRQTARERDRAEQVTELLVDLFMVPDPSDRGQDVTAREILDRGAAKVREELNEDPEVQAALMTALGRVYRNLGLYEPAAPLLEQAVDLRRQVHAGPRAETAESLAELGELFYAAGNYPAAEGAFRESLAVRREISGADDPEIATLLSNLAVMAQVQGRLDEAEGLLAEALEMQQRLYPEEHEDIARTLNNLAVLLQNGKGDHAAAEPLLRRSLEIKRRLKGDTHPDIALALNNLALLLQEMENYSAAEPLYREALEIARGAFGEEHPNVARTLSNLAILHQRQGKFTAAESLFQQSLTMRRKLLGPEHPDVAKAEERLQRLLKERDTVR